MAAFHILVFLAGISYASSASIQSRIVGGQVSSIEDYPFLVQVESLRTITNTWSSTCAGNILTARYILSAAQCFEGTLYEPSHRRIRAGSNQRMVGGQVIELERSVLHPSYGRSGYDGDIAVVYLARSLEYNPVVQRGIIATQGWQVPDNAAVVHAGWGMTEEDGKLSDLLREVSIYTVNRDICRERYANSPNPAEITDNMICAGLLDVGGQDACQGDNGGPMYYGGVIIGIVSFSNGCAQPNYPGVSTAVSAYTDWIIEQASQV